MDMHATNCLLHNVPVNSIRHNVIVKFKELENFVCYHKTYAPQVHNTFISLRQQNIIFQLLAHIYDAILLLYTFRETLSWNNVFDFLSFCSSSTNTNVPQISLGKIIGIWNRAFRLILESFQTLKYCFEKKGTYIILFKSTSPCRWVSFFKGLTLFVSVPWEKCFQPTFPFTFPPP